MKMVDPNQTFKKVEEYLIWKNSSIQLRKNTSVISPYGLGIYSQNKITRTIIFVENKNPSGNIHSHVFQSKDEDELQKEMEEIYKQRFCAMGGETYNHCPTYEELFIYVNQNSYLIGLTNLSPDGQYVVVYEITHRDFRYYDTVKDESFSLSKSEFFKLFSYNNSKIFLIIGK
jgi:hypothetical protein